MTHPDIDLVLFDLGGVLIELGDVSSLQEVATSVGTDEQWRERLASPCVRKFEKGECSETDFAVQVVSEWGLDVAPDRFLQIFRDWPTGPYPGTTDLLLEVKRSAQIGCLSNTNTMHWRYQSATWPVLDMFDFQFLSFELGFAKPDEAVFQAVADRLPFSRDRILYFDDVAVNSDAARSFGFRSEQVRGIGELKSALRGFGIASRLSKCRRPSRTGHSAKNIVRT